MASPPLVIDIPNGPEVNFIIGRQGNNINELQTRTGCHIAVQKAQDMAAGAAKRQVTITGASEEACNHCAALIHAKVSEYHATQAGALPASNGGVPPPYASPLGYGAPPPYGVPPTAYGGMPPGYGAPHIYSAPYGMPGSAPIAGDGGSLVIEVSHGPEINHLIGVRGASINALQAETGTHIAVQKPSDMAPGSTVRTVTISGADGPARERCASLVRRKIAEHRQSLEAPGGAPAIAPGASVEEGGAASMATAVAASIASQESKQTVIEIPNGPEVNHLIGVKGSSINFLQNETGAHISVQKAHEVPAGVNVRVVTITGDVWARTRCAELVRTKVAEYTTGNAGGNSDHERSAKRMRSAPPPPGYPPPAHSAPYAWPPDPYAAYYGHQGYSGYANPYSYPPPGPTYAPPPSGPPPPGYSPDPFAPPPAGYPTNPYASPPPAGLPPAGQPPSSYPLPPGQPPAGYPPAPAGYPPAPAGYPPAPAGYPPPSAYAPPTSSYEQHYNPYAAYPPYPPPSGAPPLGAPPS